MNKVCKYYKSIPKDMLYTSIAFLIIFFITEKCIDCYLLDVSSAALILTLIVIFFYTKYTFEILRGQDSVSASLWFENQLHQPLNNQQILIPIANHSKYSIETHCQVDFYLFGEKLNYNGFYNNEWPLLFQPHGGIRGHIDLPQIYQQKGYKLEDLKLKEYVGTEFPPGRSSFEAIVDFWYRRMDSNDEFIHNPKSYYVIDLNGGIVITMDNGLLTLGEEKK